VCQSGQSVVVTDGPGDAVPAWRKALVGEPEYVEIVIVAYDPAWARRFEVEKRTIATALCERAVRVEHIGSTSVVGLAAKPIIDLCLAVADSSDEAAYVPISKLRATRCGYASRNGMNTAC
jgi:GrpB-like predicted nucleotidyltransferase (UPF0157 family)